MVLTVTKGAPFTSMVALQLAFCILSTVQARDFDCPPGASLDLTNAERNASGFVSESGHFFPESKTTNDQNGVLRGCICDVKPCLALCPPKGAEPGRTIVVDDYAKYEAIPKVYTANATPDDEVNAIGHKEWFHFLVWLPCPGMSMYHLDPENDEYDKFHLLREGSLLKPRLDPEERIQGFEEYCLDLMPNETSYRLRVCTGEIDEPEVSKAQYIARLVTLPFIIATIIVYSVIPRLKNIHGTTLRCYLCCLTVTNVTLPLDRIPDTDSNQTGPWCLVLGFTIYFSIISGFLWLNVTCLDLWWRFGSCGSLRNPGRQQDAKRFIWYSIYVWGTSVLVTAICIVMEFAPGIPETSAFYPGFKSGGCWFSSEAAKALYYVGPIGLIIFSNVVLFVATAIKLAQHKKKTKRNFNSRASRRHNDKKQWFGLYLRLSIAMGICWSTEVIASVWDGPWYLSFVAEMINALQGLLVFAIFVCKKSILVSLKERYGKKKLTASQTAGSDWKLKRMGSQLIDTSGITPEDTITKVSTTSE